MLPGVEGYNIYDLEGSVELVHGKTFDQHAELLHLAPATLIDSQTTTCKQHR